MGFVIFGFSMTPGAFYWLSTVFTPPNCPVNRGHLLDLFFELAFYKRNYFTNACTYASTNDAWHQCVHFEHVPNNEEPNKSTDQSKFTHFITLNY